MLAKIADKPKAITPIIRWMIRRDLPEVLAIENQCFEYWSWKEADFIDHMRQRNCIGMVAEHEQKVVGFMLYFLTKERLDLVNFAVAPAHHGKRIGFAMVHKLVNKLSPTPGRRNMIRVHVRETNLEAQLFFREMGFKATQVLQDHWRECDEDAYRFEYRYRADA